MCRSVAARRAYVYATCPDLVKSEGKAHRPNGRHAIDEAILSPRLKAFQRNNFMYAP